MQKTKNKLYIDKYIRVNFDIREHQNVLLKVYILNNTYKLVEECLSFI